MFFYEKQDGVQCDYCDFWIHRICARLSKEEYDKPVIMFLNLSIVGIVTVNIFPVFSLTNPKMSTMFNRHKKDWKKIVPSVKRCSEKVWKNALDNIENWLKFSDT